jgi:hypothetical protein
MPPLKTRECIQKMSNQYLNECFELVEGGRLFWRDRPDSHFPTRALAMTMNKTLAGKEAGSLHSNGYKVIRIMAMPAFTSTTLYSQSIMASIYMTCQSS